MLTPSQAARLKACTRAIDAPARVVVAGHDTDSAVAALRAGAAPRVEVIAAAPDALDQVDGPIDVLFVARTGRYSASAEALERWGARVVPGGTMFVHGAFASPPVTAALLRTVGSSPGWRYFGRDGALAEYTRAALTPGERTLNTVAQLAQLPAFARALVRRRLGLPPRR